MNTMIKLKNILSEGFAWERKEGKGLPTLDEVQAEYEKKLREDAQNEDFGGSYGGNKNRRWSKPLYSRGEWVDDPNDDKGGSPIKVTAWDTLVDEYNGKHGYSTSTKSDSRVYESEIGNLSVGMEWKVSFRNSEWRYQLYKLGQLANIFRNLDELISHFKDNNGGNNVTESVITEEAQDKVSSRTHVVYACNVELADGSIKPGVRISVPKGNDAEKQVRDKIMARFGKDCKIRSMAKGQNPHNNDNDKDEPRWQDNDGDGKWYEKGDDVKENVNESFVGRLKKNFIGGATRK